MIISAASDYRAAAQRTLPPFLFHYIDGGAYAEYTLRRNVEDLSQVALRQRGAEKYVRFKPGNDPV
ncbi:L-lactate dehydrogenase [Salmonella enterica subsp. enterica serovar Daytona]|uniref:L-lactate dehydrogenase n=1 Tax=Salmonella enterica subsp. enterica serovar Daytona TaxID=1962639 RepID=A0A447JAD0_SALET|nr:L-lactate dehydrogenase [Salmonella enterica subsp. enterica serovar Daytona]